MKRWLMLSAALGLPWVCWADVDVGWYVIGGGGGQSAGGAYAVRGTIGQPVIGRVVQEGVQVDAGFWAFTMIVQQEGAPKLYLEWATPTTVRLAWRAEPGAAVLQVTDSLTLPNWVDVLESPTWEAGINRLVLAPAGTVRFYRLRVLE